MAQMCLDWMNYGKVLKVVQIRSLLYSDYVPEDGALISFRVFHANQTSMDLDPHLKQG